MKLIGVDVGGTFTDMVFTDTETGRTIIHKAPTTLNDPSQGVIMGVGELCERFGLARGEIDHVLHGTTIATNAVLEYNGAVTGTHSRWVGTRRVALRYVSSSPPFSTVRATFTAHGAAPLVILHGLP